MDTVGAAALWTFLAGRGGAVRATNGEVRADRGHAVADYPELAARIAELQFRNRGLLLLFRGQNRDHRNASGNTTLAPSIFRNGRARRGWPRTLHQRYARLAAADAALAARWTGDGLFGRDRVRRHRLVRWAILQHYGVCDTPLLDATHSLRIACSFAADGAGDEAVLMVLALPQLAGAVTASAEAGVQAIRLASACPPHAVRPHLQEGYLLGEYPPIEDPAQGDGYDPHEVDFGRRLVAKFRFDPAVLWTPAFPRVPRAALYPEDDPMQILADELRAGLPAVG
ncbi:MAG: hypothetical protein RLZZ127_1604 [Planctomycetota bacterium]|jgi:hypothetical protein